MPNVNKAMLDTNRLKFEIFFTEVDINTRKVEFFRETEV